MPSEVDSPTKALLVISKLAREYRQKEVTIREFIDDLFDFKGSHSEKEYDKLLVRIADSLIPRLKRANLVMYDVMRTTSKECIVYGVVNDTDPLDKKIVEKLQGEYSTSSVDDYIRYAGRIVSSVNDGLITCRDISKAMRLSGHCVGAVLPMLRKVGVLGIVSGKSRDENGTLKLLPQGAYFYDRYIKPVLAPLSFFDLTRNGIKFSVLNEIIEPDIERIIRLRERLIDPLENYNKLEEFREKCIEARIRHQRDSSSIKRFSK